MRIRTALICGLMWSVCADPVFAQSPPASDDGRRPRMRQMGMRGGSPEGRFDGWFERLAEDLALDDAQRAQVDQMAEPYRAKFRERGERFRQMREAMEAGDEALVEQLRAEMPDPGDLTETMEQFSTEIETVLRPEQADRLREMRARFTAMREEREARRQMIEEMPDRLNMTDEQRAEYEALVREERRSMGERMRRMREQGEMGPDGMGPEGMGPGEFDPSQMRQFQRNRGPFSDDFLNKVDGMLTDDQRPLLAQMREELNARRFEGGPPAQPGRGRQVDLRSLFRATRRVDLQPDQEDELRDIEREAMRAQRDIRGNDRDAQALLIRETRAKVEALLTDEQKSQLRSALDRGQRPQRRPRGEPAPR
jgi:Spy/CpxP family protein refolding chaperone